MIKPLALDGTATGSSLRDGLYWLRLHKGHRESPIRWWGSVTDRNIRRGGYAILRYSGCTLDARLMNSKPLSEPIAAAVDVLVAEARHGRLAVCAGAGLSLAADLPSGPTLAQSIDRQYQGRVDGYTSPGSDDLVEIASAVAALPAGLESLQLKIVRLAPFQTATPSLAHRLLALLLVEGSLRLLTTNWDDCIERGWTEERINVAADGVEAEQMRDPHILKVHGCCTRPATLLVTTAQLEEPPLWTRSALSSEIAASSMVFVGVGDVPPYVKEPIRDLTSFVEGARVRVVSPGIVDRWERSEWRGVLPDLDDARRIAMTADAFADELARGWINQLTHTLDPDLQLESVLICQRAFSALSALEALQWLRRATVGWPVGESVVTSSQGHACLRAIAVLSDQVREKAGLPAPAAVEFEPRAAVVVEDHRVEVLLVPSMYPMTAVIQAVRSRAAAAAGSHGASRVAVLCAVSNLVGNRPTVLQPEDIMMTDDVSLDDIVEGPTQVPVDVHWADDLLRCA